MRRFVAIAGVALLIAACNRIDVAAMFDAYVWEKRVLVVLAPARDDAQLKAQYAAVTKEYAALRERDFVVWWLVSNQSVIVDADAKPHLFTRPFYEYFKADEDAFTVLVLGLDGEEKLRTDKVLDVDAIVKLVDAMPMRKKEAMGR